ncbi:Asp-tRNA(Asn)/Glu-tRNA(Gln) amidotransferase A subunit family amidase [Palleronia aestuarii]|uniref:Asp-tRNA(Asn)/Glu-tRNA(Gln) amidotransferase A subunit family amidase n=1 Tax=Palleronia aestuarii TaxID=568105 RepID=A0A2W7NQG0_9RHOB|nr:amidase family protein [Palleronia aestuarii]PZX18864.1 Asp-tRNA(Asn)/Glu-tRNA(Gln) amidotransferase A subunit family amidase [Palleronia aestuarii]
MSDPADLTARDALEAIRRRTLSPVELARACIARTEAVNPAVNAIVAWSPETCLAEAERAEAAVMRGALGRLTGLPVAVKDMIDVADLPTTFGSEIYADNVAQGDDPIVREMRGAGAVILGKTNCPEWSAGANTRNRVYGATGNPYDPTRSSAGSSGGSAVALACGMAPLATGSDMGGSLRNPASFCGVVGMRPSPGVVPGETRGLATLWLSSSGPMARNVDDAALMLDVMARPDRGDPFSPARPDWGDLAHPGEVDPSTLRIAATEDFGFAPVEGIVRRAFRAALAKLSLGHAEETPDCSGADRIFSVLRAVSFLGGHLDYTRDYPDKVGPNVHENVAEGLGYSALDVARALTDQSAYYRRWQAFFDEYDLLLAPAITISPRDWHELYPTEIDGQRTESYFHWLACAYATTIAGHPCLSLPCGLDEAGMPFGLQLIGRRGDDRALLAAAASIETIIAGDPDLRTPPPDIAALATARPISEMPGFLDL